MSEANWDTLVNNLRDGSCVPFLGAGACVPALPSGAELATEILGRAKLKVPFPFDEHTNLAKVAQYIAAVSGDAPGVKRLVAEAIRDRAATAKARGPAALPDLQRCLAELRLPIYLTTNYDDLLEHAFRDVSDVAPQSEICRWSDDLLTVSSRFDDGKYEPSPKEPLIFHLHGRWTESNTGQNPSNLGRSGIVGYESMVVTEDDYLDFLVNVSREIAVSPSGREEKTALPLVLRKAIKSRPLFFVGYGLSDVNFLFILRALIRTMQPHMRVQRVAVQIDPKTLPQGHNTGTYRRQVEQYFEWTYQVNVLWRSAEEVARALRSEFGLVSAAS
jgi:hypothetical protein